MLSEQEFQTASDAALQDLYKALSAAADHHPLEPDFNEGALTIEFEEPPGKFVVSPNRAVSQIWISALVKSFKLNWDPARSSFVLPETGQSLRELMADLAGRQLGELVIL
jgi:iron donor protein CyaY